MKIDFGCGQARCNRKTPTNVQTRIPGVFSDDICGETLFWIENNLEIICSKCGTRYKIFDTDWEEVPEKKHD